MLELLSAGGDKVISHFTRWLERGQKRTFKPVPRTAQVNETLSLDFNRLLIAVSSLFLIKLRVSIDTTQSTWAELWNCATGAQVPFLSLRARGTLQAVERTEFFSET